MSTVNDPNPKPVTPASDDPYLPAQPQLVAPLPTLPAPPRPHTGPVYSTSVPTNAWAIVSLVASILSWLGLFGIGGIVGIIAGLIARSEIVNSHGTQTGDGLALAGIIIGAINLVASCLVAVCVFSAFASIPFLFMGSGR